MSKPAKDLRSRTRPEHVALLDRAAEAGEHDSIIAACEVADVLVELGWLELRVKIEYDSVPAERASYGITPHGLRVHAKVHGRSLTASTPVPEPLSDLESDEPEPFGCGPLGRTYAAQADTWGLDR